MSTDTNPHLAHPCSNENNSNSNTSQIQLQTKDNKHAPGKSANRNTSPTPGAKMTIGWLAGVLCGVLLVKGWDVIWGWRRPCV
ncbi:hypothetical protein BDW02DRAFT_573836 [Decorospora gaudefroyi]|uniref:Uncharacterized protein n=1 Tax=Decorospora gaudefroyi TaxID=184978 RepID=A0A6A5K522_9PLEO|nr:hypothetical protein BDW02DRAFT_573836 [Decorospora gaudefroyi]